MSNGTLVVTLGDATLVAAATIQIKGSASVTLGNATLVATYKDDLWEGFPAAAGSWTPS